MLVASSCVLSDIKFEVCVFLSGDRNLGDNVTDGREILHDGRSINRTSLLSFWRRYL